MQFPVIYEFYHENVLSYLWALKVIQQKSHLFVLFTESRVTQVVSKNWLCFAFKRTNQKFRKLLFSYQYQNKAFTVLKYFWISQKWKTFFGNS